MDLEWDPAKARSNFFKHGIRFSDVEPAFYDQYALSMRDPDVTSEERYVLVGMDAPGRLVVVICAWRGDTIRIISARRATKAEQRHYEK